jgi:hypothetical protein
MSNQDAEHAALETGPTADNDGVDYTPMPVAESTERKKIYNAEIDGIQSAAAEVTRAREEARVPQEPEPTPREYRLQNGLGDKVPANQTITPEKAADDLTALREQELNAQTPDPAEVANAIDAARAEYLQQPAQPEAQQQPQEQPQQQPVDDGIDPEIRQALENPKVRAALEAEVASVEQARQQYVSATRTAAQLSAAALFSQFPELSSLTEAQLPIALQMIQRQDPAKAAAIENAFQRTKGLWQASQAAEQQRAATQQRVQTEQTKAWIAQQDKAYDAAVNDTPEQRARLGAEAVAMLKEYGATDSEISAAWHSPGPFRSAVGQRILRDAAAHRLAQRGVADKISKPVVPVQRPGISRPQDNSEDVSAAMRRFNANPTPKNAAEILLARRAANRR